MSFIHFNKIFSIFQRIGQALMLPVSVLPAAGLLVALGRLLQKIGESGSVPPNELIQSLGNIFF